VISWCMQYADLLEQSLASPTPCLSPSESLWKSFYGSRGTTGHSISEDCLDMGWPRIWGGILADPMMPRDYQHLKGTGTSFTGLYE
jgi:hypothetical protein